MNDELNQVKLLRIYALKERAVAQYTNDTGSKNASVDNSQVTNVNKTDFVIVRDKNFNILAHYQLQDDESLFRLDNDQK